MSNLCASLMPTTRRQGALQSVHYQFTYYIYMIPTVFNMVALPYKGGGSEGFTGFPVYKHMQSNIFDPKLAHIWTSLCFYFYPLI
ncbi:hypothetical protein BDV09DRAFT_94517 [Aspergillus tetrazonus]